MKRREAGKRVEEKFLFLYKLYGYSTEQKLKSI